jgi:hypothetical protein
VATDIKFDFVATGSNDGRANSFTAMATSHAIWMVKRLNALKGKASSPLKPPAIVRFVHFDWENDRILVYEHPFPEKGSKDPKPVWKELSAFTSTEGTEDFEPKGFITKSAEISIVDIYRAVRKAPRGSVLDVSIYSHGFIDGPVLANTGDAQLTAKTGEPIRTESDRDGRVRSDFTPHMGEQDVKANKNALTEFRGGFASAATLRVYGCHVQDIVDGTAFVPDAPRALLRSTAFEVIRAAYVVQLAKKTAAGKELLKKKKPAAVTLDMGYEFDLEDEKNNTSDHLTNFTKAQLKTLHYGLDPLFFPDKDTGPLKFEKPFTEVIKFIARQTKLGYVFKAAEALPDVACFGAVPGSGGDYETSGSRLMFVPKNDWGPILLFFTNFMGISLDERNYGRFDAAAVAAINERELHG